METKKVVDQLLKNGSKVVKGLKVTSVSISFEETHTRLAVTVDTPVDGYVKDEKDNWVLGKTRTIFISLFNVTGLIKNTTEYGFAANQMVENPKGMLVLMSGATINIVQEPVKADTDYVNPFSEKKDKEPYHVEHDNIFNHIVDITFSDFARRMLDQLAMSMVGV